MKFSNLLLKMLLPFLVMKFSVTDEEGGSDATLVVKPDVDAETARLAQEALDDVDAGKKSNISDSEAKLLKDVMAKKNALKVANDSLLKVSEQLKAFEGIDPAQVRDMLKQRKDAETAQLESQGNWDKLKAQMAEAHVVEMTGAKTQLSVLETTVADQANTISELTVGNAFINSNFIKDELLMTLSKTRIAYNSHFSYEDGVIVGYDKPSNSKDRSLLVDSVGEPLKFEEALRKIVDADPDRDQILRSKVKQGSGGNTDPKAKVPPASNVKAVAQSGREKITGAISDFLKNGK